MSDLGQAIERARELLQTSRHAAMATVNEDGSPHNTPYFFMYDEDLEYLYWGSHKNSLHSQNVERTGQVFVVLFDAIENSGGLYIKADQAHATSGDELTEALRVHNIFRAREGKDELYHEYYQGSSPQRMYCARAIEFSVSMSERNTMGLLKRDYRKEINREELLIV